MNESKNWYYKVNKELQLLSLQYNLSLETIVGIFVSCSGQTPYVENMRQCKEFLSSGKITGIMNSKQKLISCRRIIAGENPLEVWLKTSHKYRNFYHSILLRDGSMCIDTHMINMYLEQHPYSKLFNYNLSSIFKSKKLLEPINNWIRKQAEANQLKTFEMQSVLWVEYRGKMW